MSRNINKVKLQERLEVEELMRNKELDRREKDKREREKGILYLGEIISLEKPEFQSNNLILAPTGSGKSHFIQKQLIPKYVKEGDKIYYLVSNTALKDSVCPALSEERKALSEKGSSLGFFTTDNKESFGGVKYRVHVMTYAEFGGIVSVSNKKAEESPVIFCDEIHSAQAYREINNDPPLTHAIKYLFMPHENQTIYYFTATDEHLENLKRKTKGQLDEVTTFDYREHPSIKKYIVAVTIPYNHLEQIRPHLQHRIKGFNRYGFKAIAFTAKIDQMEVMEKIFIEEGYSPLLLWSVHNKRDMTSHQLEMRCIVLKTGLIPSPYNVLIINGGMQEGWDLDDEMVRLAVINSTNQTEIIQSLGRFRGDMTTCVQKVKDKLSYSDLSIPEKYMEVVLTPESKEKLCKELNLTDEKGRQRKWQSVSRIIEQVGNTIINEQRTVNGKRQRVSIIRRPIL